MTISNVEIDTHYLVSPSSMSNLMLRGSHAKVKISYERKNHSYLSKNIWYKDRIESLDHAQKICSEMNQCGGITKYGENYELRFGNTFQVWLWIILHDSHFRCLTKWANIFFCLSFF